MDSITRTIREQITDRLRDQVVGGDFSPGQALRETEFAKRYGVSRGPVRDAFLRLAQEGLLAYHPNRGVTVSHPPRPENRAFIASLRQQIECFVARRGLKHLGTDATADIELRLEDLRDACERGDDASVARCDLAFHETLLVRCEGTDFLPVWKWLCSQMLMTYGRLESYREVYREHVAIVDAIRGGKAAAVTAALKANIR